MTPNSKKLTVFGKFNCRYTDYSLKCTTNCEQEDKCMKIGKIAAIFLTAMTLVLSACGGGTGTSAGDTKTNTKAASTSEATETSGDTMVLRLANSHNAEHITSQACQMFADLVEEKTGGRIKIETHFAGELGDERSTIEQCQFGGLDFTRVSSGAVAEFAPLMNAMQMPYLYKDVDHLFAVMDGEIGQEVFDTLEDNNLVGITYLHPGSRNFFNAKKEIHTPGDMAGMKIRVSESDLMLNLMDCLGASGVGLPFNDTYSSIQSGVVDGAENNMTSYIEMSFYEVAPYWTYDGHSYMPDMILASKQTMDKLSDEDQEIIRECAHEAEQWHKEAWEESEEKNAKIAEEKGCTLTTLTDEELQQFKDAVQPMYESFLNEEQNELVSRIQELGE